MTKEELKDDLNTDIINRIEAKNIEIVLIPSANTYWTSELDLVNNKCYIGHFTTNYPKACYTHEILHIDTQLKGYKQLRYGISAFDQTPYFITLLETLDNELQHHRMFEHFKYPKEHFYIDTDNETENKLRLYLNRPLKEFKQAFLYYLTLISPGGHINNSDKNILKENFRNINGRSFADFFVHIDNVFYEWQNSDSYDNSNPLKQIFLALPNGEITYFGYQDKSQFPNDGFFVDKPFDVKEK